MVRPTGVQWAQFGLVGAFGVLAVAAWCMGFPTGKEMGATFLSTLGQMARILPCAFVLVALFDTWVKRESVERHLGKTSGARGYALAMVLGGMTIGGMYLAFPVAYSLFRKGARLSVVLAYVGFAGACRIPMTTFEASFMGGKFTAVRLAVAIPLIIASSIILGGILERRGYEVRE